jgi:hypothetical protein
MVKSVANSAITALRRKRSLLETAEKLHSLKADEDANTLCEQIPALDNRIDQARETLQEALTQLTLMESEQDSGQLSHLGGVLCERLKVAEQIARDVSSAHMQDVADMRQSDTEQRARTAVPESRLIEERETPDQPNRDRSRDRKKTR